MVLLGDYKEAQVIEILTIFIQCNITLNCLHFLKYEDVMLY